MKINLPISDEKKFRTKNHIFAFFNRNLCLFLENLCEEILERLSKLMLMRKGIKLSHKCLLSDNK